MPLLLCFFNLSLLVVPFVAFAGGGGSGANNYNYRKDKGITPIKYTFNYNISDVFIDPVAKTAMLNMEGNTRFVVCNLETQEIVLDKANTPGVEPYYCHVDGVVFKKEWKKNHLIDIETGKKKWSTETNVLHTNKTYNRAIGTFGGTYQFNTIEGSSLSTGKTMWSRPVKKNHGWSHLEYLNDSVVLIAASGLHAVNLRTGEGWDYNAVTEIKEQHITPVRPSPDATPGRIGIAVGLPSGNDGYVHGICSNILVEKGKIYFATQKEIVCLNRKGNILWQKKLDKNTTSASYLVVQNDYLYMINKGVAYAMDKTVKFGKPYVAAFALGTGSKLFQTDIPGSDNEPVKDYIVKGAKICFLLDNQIVSISLATGQQLGNWRFDTASSGTFTNFIDTDIYTMSDKTRKKIKQSSTKKIYVATSQRKVVIFNSDFSEQEMVSANTLYLHQFDVDDVMFLKKGSKIYVYDEYNRPVSMFSALGQVIVTKNRIYAVKGKDLLEIEKRQVMP